MHVRWDQGMQTVWQTAAGSLTSSAVLRDRSEIPAGFVPGMAAMEAMHVLARACFRIATAAQSTYLHRSLARYPLCRSMVAKEYKRKISSRGGGRGLGGDSFKPKGLPEGLNEHYITRELPSMHAFRSLVFVSGECVMFSTSTSTKYCERHNTDYCITTSTPGITQLDTVGFDRIVMHSSSSRAAQYRLLHKHEYPGFTQPDAVGFVSHEALCFAWRVVCMKYNHTWLAGHYRRINALPAMYDSILMVYPRPFISYPFALNL